MKAVVIAQTRLLCDNHAQNKMQYKIARDLNQGDVLFFFRFFLQEAWQVKIIKIYFVFIFGAAWFFSLFECQDVKLSSLLSVSPWT